MWEQELQKERGWVRSWRGRKREAESGLRLVGGYHLSCLGKWTETGALDRNNKETSTNLHGPAILTMSQRTGRDLDPVTLLLPCDGLCQPLAQLDRAMNLWALQSGEHGASVKKPQSLQSSLSPLGFLSP